MCVCPLSFSLYHFFYFSSFYFHHSSPGLGFFSFACVLYVYFFFCSNRCCCCFGSSFLLFLFFCVFVIRSISKCLHYVASDLNITERETEHRENSCPDIQLSNSKVATSCNFVVFFFLLLFRFNDAKRQRQRPFLQQPWFSMGMRMKRVKQSKERKKKPHV